MKEQNSDQVFNTYKQPSVPLLGPLIVGQVLAQYLPSELRLEEIGKLRPHEVPDNKLYIYVSMYTPIYIYVYIYTYIFIINKYINKYICKFPNIRKQKTT